MTGPGLGSDPGSGLGSGLGSDPGGPWVADSGDENQQVPARDAAQLPLVGTAVIAGIVTTAGDRPQPLRRAAVTLGGGAGGGRLVMTDDTGRFELAQLPSGRYTLRAEKPAYLTMWYGATRPDRSGTSIQLADGQRMADVTLRLVRGATISGVIRDDRGQPAPGIRVQALTYRVVNGERRLSSAGLVVNYDGGTDDRGAYRIYGLAPGDYAVVALNRAATSFRLTTEADIDAAMQAARQPAAGRAGGAAATVTASRTAATASPGMSYAPSYFPGTPDVSAATMLSVAAGEDKVQVDFAIGFVPTATVEGTVTSAMGPLPANLDVRLVNTGRAPVLSVDFGSIFPHRPGPDGSFRFRGIVPGRYVVAATTGAGASPLWATADVAVNGTDISGITLSLQPGMTVSGRINYRATSKPVPSLPGTRVALGPQLTGSQISVGQLQVPAREDGSFSVTGVMPGRYTVRVLPPIGTTGWLVGSAMLKDVDLADHLLEVRPGENITGIGITLIDQPADLSGVLQDVGGRPASEYYVIVFPADRTMWRQGARRIFQTRPGTDGKFQFRALVGGEYLLAAVTDVETGEWFDPVFLTELARAAVKVTITTGESKVQDIRIAK
jgi:hypothetical protein